MSETIEQMKYVFSTRQKFIIMGLTGRTGSGCTEAAELLSKSISELAPPAPTGLEGTSDKKYKLVYDFAKENWSRFVVIRVRDVITSFILLEPFEHLQAFVNNLIASKPDPITVVNLEPIKESFDVLHEKRLQLKGMPEANPREIFEKQNAGYKFYFEELPEFTEGLKKALGLLADNLYTSIYQKIGDNIRSSGRPYDDTFTSGHLFAMSLRINRIIKILSAKARPNSGCVFVAIDAIRNPFEAVFFRERYSAFYLMSINTPDSDRIKRLQALDYNESIIRRIDDKEYPKSLSAKQRFISQDIQKCIEISDIHVNNPGSGTKVTNTLKKQLIYYASLIMHPGLVTPSRHERCMQVAYTAKLNSGCISRQVGAVITNSDFSIKAVGWNEAASGQVSCALRSVENLINHESEKCFSHYEFNDAKFRTTLDSIYKSKVSALSSNDRKGLNLSFCFKDIQNCVDEQKNQVHTRALHAEENAFLQITKYGGSAIKGGYLYSTASPCELCSKKAYQLGIREIVFIDPYPGIANTHLLRCGENDPKLTLFNGAVGKAFYQLYQPLFAYKDELNVLLDLEMPNAVRALKEENAQLRKELGMLKA